MMLCFLGILKRSQYTQGQTPWFFVFGIFPISAWLPLRVWPLRQRVESNIHTYITFRLGAILHRGPGGWDINIRIGGNTVLPLREVVAAAQGRDNQGPHWAVVAAVEMGERETGVVIRMRGHPHFLV